MSSNILETMIDLESTNNSLSPESSPCNNETIPTSEVKGYPVINIKDIMEKFEFLYKNFKAYMKHESYPIKTEINFEENCLPEAATAKYIYIYNMKNFCDKYQDIVEPLCLYKYHKYIKSLCLGDFYKLFRMNEDEGFSTNYDLQRKKLECELDNVSLDIYNENRKKISHL